MSLSQYHYNNLSHMHEMKPARDIDITILRIHLTLDHGVSSKDARTRAQMGRLHLLAHAVDAFPDLKELLNLSEATRNETREVMLSHAGL